MTDAAKTRLEILVAARKLLNDPAAWMKYDFSDWGNWDPELEHQLSATDDEYWQTGTFCARCSWGALAEAAQRGARTDVVIDAKTFLEKIGDIDIQGLGAWNDKPYRKWEHVTALFDKAIEAEKERLRTFGTDEVFDLNPVSCWGSAP